MTVFLYSVSSAIKQVDIKFDLVLIFHMLVYRREEVRIGSQIQNGYDGVTFFHPGLSQFVSITE